MSHYVLVDNYSGYVWGEANASDPIEACKIVDQDLGGEAREYEETHFGGSDASGYHVYKAPSNWTAVDDGQAQTEIERVVTLCHKVAEVSFRTIG